MKRKITLFFIFFSSFVFAQPTLHPHIGLSGLPNDSDPICSIPVYTGSFSASGIQEGDTAADFTLYSISGDSFNLATTLATGKKVLMISSSYTCPVFRGKVPSINNVVSLYGSQVVTIIIYTPEAHPTDISPYFGVVNTTSANLSAGILYDQPSSYGEKKAIVQDMLDSLTINAPIYIDGPCNNWWLHYGPAPNNAYLIDTNGIVFAKHPWYDKYPENILCDIDSLLGIPTSCATSANGQFIFQMVSADTAYGIGGNILSTSSNVINTHATEDVIVGMKRIQNVLATGWLSSFCADVCYSTSTDSVTFLIPPLDTLILHMYFYSQPGVDTSMVKIGMRNVNNSLNAYSKNLYGISQEAPSSVHSIKTLPCVQFYPNPSKELFYYRGAKIKWIEIRNVLGELIHQSIGSDFYFWNASQEKNGVYFYSILLENNLQIEKGKLILLR